MIFMAEDNAGAPVRYRDTKRYLWLLVPLLFLIPAAGGAGYVISGAPLWVLVPLVYLFVFIPLMDAALGEDPGNPPEAVIPAMTADAYYRHVLWAMIPVHYALFIGAAWLVAPSLNGSGDLPWWGVIAVIVGIGTLNGGAITLGHELGHKTDRTSRVMAKLALGVVGYGHFCIEHNRGHHVKVATPEDCSSARMGESVHAFAVRDIVGALKGAIGHETRRLHNKGKGWWSVDNDILQSWVITAGVALALALWLGPAILLFVAAHHLLAWYGLSQVNYIEHYGLLREKRANGRYATCAPRHSWNTNHVFSNLVQFHLQRHSDHHASPQRPYQALRNFEGLPTLPSGYPGSMLLANIPPLWFRVMDPKVMAWAGGDIGKVNLDPRAAPRLTAKWG